MTDKKYVFKENSLDMLRLIAATQVLLSHAFIVTNPEIATQLWFKVLEFFPGVPIFFFVSGYLISKSFEHSKSVAQYWQNRILRIYPALIFCVFLNILMVGVTGYYETVGAGFLDLLVLFIAKASIVQFYNPEFMRSFGDGVLNGSLWTICVELQFYFVVPLLYRWIINRFKRVNLILIFTIIVFIAFNRILNATIVTHGDSIAWKLFRVSFAPWFYMFLVGVLVQRNFQYLSTLVMKVPLLVLLSVYLILSYVLGFFQFEFGNYISPLLFFPLAVLIFKIAYTGADFTKAALKGNDISYGIYIWHMPILNQCVYLFDGATTAILMITIVGTMLVALGSWKLLESKALQLKKVSLK